MPKGYYTGYSYCGIMPDGRKAYFCSDDEYREAYEEEAKEPKPSLFRILHKPYSSRKVIKIFQEVYKMKGYDAEVMYLYNTKDIIGHLENQLEKRFDGDEEKGLKFARELGEKAGHESGFVLGCIVNIISNINNIKTEEEKQLIFDKITEPESRLFIGEDGNGDLWMNVAVLNISEFFKSNGLEDF